MKAVILAGGKGTRLGNLTQEIPKPMIKIGDKPVLEHQIECLKKSNITEIIMIIGHLGSRIIDYFGNGSSFGVSIEYIKETTPLGTAGALYYLKDLIEDDFLLLYGDIMLNIDFKRFIEFHKTRKSLATLYVHPNSHPYDSDLIILDDDNKVIGIDFKNSDRNYYKNCVNAGVYVVNKKLLDYIKSPIKLDFEKDIIFNIIKKGQPLYGYKSTEYIKDMGTLDRLIEVKEAYNKGIIEKKSLLNKQKCIFIDRDGTINKHKGLLNRIDDFELEDNVGDAIKAINNSEYLCILITNQPVVARNLCTVEDVKAIHNKLEILLGERGAYLDDILFCPHHPDKGYKDENPLYKIDCNCRKPKTGLIDYCASKYNIDLSNSYFIGDTTVDIMTGVNAGLKTVLVKTGEAGNDKKYDVVPDYIYNNLKEAIDNIV